MFFLVNNGLKLRFAALVEVEKDIQGQKGDRRLSFRTPETDKVHARVLTILILPLTLFMVWQATLPLIIAPGNFFCFVVMTI